MKERRYGELLARYRMDGPFRELADAFADGMSMDVIEAHPQEGLILHPREDSPFRHRLLDMPRRVTGDSRLLLGLVHVAIAARAYPTPADLEQENIVRVSVGEVDEFLRHAAQRHKAAGQDETGLERPGGDPTAVWRVYERRPSGRPGTDGQVTRGSTQRLIKEVLEWLVHQGLAVLTREVGDAAGGWFACEC
ncbi:hypothetical protein ACFVXI_20360, partial [Kitasatospora herbaricolor]